MKDKTIDYLLTLDGWCTEEKMMRLYNLVKEAAEECDKPLTVELGVFAGRSLFPMAAAHHDIGKGVAVGLDSWDNITPLEGSNHPDNNKYWKNLNMQAVFNSFVAASKRPEWSEHVKYLKGRSDAFADSFPDGSINVLHQDSNHNVETITKELELWSPKVRAGGYWIIDDSDWPETKEGYAKLPEFGFELYEDHGSWQIWKKKAQ